MNENTKEFNIPLYYSFGVTEDCKWYSDEDEAVRMANLIYHFGGLACVLSDIWEYTPGIGWKNMVY